MAEFENGSATQLIEDAFSNYDFDNYRDVPGKEYLESLNTTATFFEHVQRYARRIGYNGDDTDALAKYVFTKGEENEVPLSSLTTVKNWLKKAPPPGNQTGRENVYRLCFALEMDAEETKMFFLKAYLERPFNYKDVQEAVYFFCLNNGLKYPDAKRMIATIESVDLTENADAESNTEKIGYDISLLKTEEDFVKYIVENRSGFAVQNQTATDMIQHLLTECMDLAQKEHNLFHQDEITVNNIDELLTAITGYYARETCDGEKVFKKSISKSKFPDAIKKNFPQREQFKNIEDGTASFDVIRKALVLLKFYHFFASALLHNAKNLEHGLFDEFVDETNKILAACGYVQLYWLNPYDWMFGYCAWAPNPLDEFKNVIDVFYLSDPEIYNTSHT